MCANVVMEHGRHQANVPDAKLPKIWIAHIALAHESKYVRLQYDCTQDHARSHQCVGPPMIVDA